MVSGSRFTLTSSSAVHTAGTKALRTGITEGKLFCFFPLLLRERSISTLRAARRMKMFQGADKELSSCLPETSPSGQA